ncbi:asparagine synthase-domain-containing protein [Mortierella sp. GBAus27b]|nr:asparagine synthase-domain-containing protein [Mortierella sp. GBAus27b]
MCGILLRIQDQSNKAHTDTWSALEHLNAKRGPSAQDSHNTIISFNDAQNHVDLTFYGAVLHLRGDIVTRQPHVSEAGNILLWNGEIFDGIAVDHHQNDGRVLMDQLEKIALQCTGQEHLACFVETMAKIEGPYAFVYFHTASKTIFFGRDCLGRRSLLWHRNGSQEESIQFPFILTSVGDLLTLDEVPADGIYGLTLGSNSENMVTKYPWVHSTPSEQVDSLGTPLSMQLPFGKVNDRIPTDEQLPQPFPDGAKYDQAHPDIVPDITEDMMKAITDTIAVLGDSVRRRVQDIPRTGHIHRHLTFDPMCTSLPHDARVAILFSGGLDCLCLAAFADRYLPQGEAIDLLNVGFENPRSVRAKAAEEALAQKRLNKQGASTSNSGSSSQSARTIESKFTVPDRVTGYESLAELRAIAPHRNWNFVEINVPFEEANAHRSEILERMAPLETVMDLSVAMAFWFASRGIGYLKNEMGELVPYTSQAKVLLSGLGADEQLGGYSRHKERFKTGGWKGLINELQLDLDRISTRNLGRDDRIISDHGKEARYPYLSTHVVQFLSQLRVDLKVDLRYPRGVGEKILLRHVARELGFVRASSHWKRAVQFGARTAKMTEGGRSEVGQQIVNRDAE